MKMTKTKAVRMRVVVQRINRELATKGQILMTTRHMRMTQHFGDYYLLDLSGNVVDMDTTGAQASAQRAIVAPHGAPGDKASGATPAPRRAYQPRLRGRHCSRRYVLSLD